MANGRRRKKILSLETETGTTTNPEQIQEQIYNFYKQLFGRQPTRHVGVSENDWAEGGRLDSFENEEL